MGSPDHTHTQALERVAKMETWRETLQRTHFFNRK